MLWLHLLSGSLMILAESATLAAEATLLSSDTISVSLYRSPTLVLSGIDMNIIEAGEVLTMDPCSDEMDRHL